MLVMMYNPIKMKTRLGPPITSTCGFFFAALRIRNVIHSQLIFVTVFFEHSGVFRFKPQPSGPSWDRCRSLPHPIFSTLLLLPKPTSANGPVFRYPGADQTGALIQLAHIRLTSPKRWAFMGSSMTSPTQSDIIFSHCFSPDRRPLFSDANFVSLLTKGFDTPVFFWYRPDLPLPGPSPDHRNRVLLLRMLRLGRDYRRGGALCFPLPYRYLLLLQAWPFPRTRSFTLELKPTFFANWGGGVISPP